MRRSELAYIIQMARADQNQYGLDCTGSRLENLGACPQEVLGVQYQLWASGTTKDQFLAQIAMAIIPVPGVDDLSGLADAGLAAAEDTGASAAADGMPIYRGVAQGHNAFADAQQGIAQSW